MEWSRIYGGDADDELSDVVELPDGRLAFAGSTSSFGTFQHNGWLLVTDATGGIDSEHRYGESTTSDLYELEVSGDELLAVGQHGGQYWLLGTDDSGETRFSWRGFRLNDRDFSTFNHLALLPNGDPVVVGSEDRYNALSDSPEYAEGYFVSSTATGDGASFAVSGLGYAVRYNAVAVDEQGGVLAGGGVVSGGIEGALLARVFADRSSTVLSGRIEPTRSIDDSVASVLRVPGENAWIVVGTCYSSSDDGIDAYALELRDGDTMSIGWQHLYGVNEGALRSGERGFVFASAIRGDEIILVGSTRAAGSNDVDAWIFAVALADGAPRWQRIIEGIGLQSARGITILNDSGIAIVGASAGDAWAAKLAPGGDDVPASASIDAEFIIGEPQDEVFSHDSGLDVDELTPAVPTNSEEGEGPL